MKTVNSKIAYAVLCMHIDNLEKRYDKYRLEGVSGRKLYHMLTTEKERRIIDDKIEDAISAIDGKLMRGEITPMMLSEKSRRRSAYSFYLRYLKNVIYPTDPSKADELAYEVYKSVLMNDIIGSTDYFEDEYFSVLLAERRRKSVYKEVKEESRLADGALRIYN